MESAGWPIGCHAGSSVVDGCSEACYGVVKAEAWQCSQDPDVLRWQMQVRPLMVWLGCGLLPHCGQQGVATPLPPNPQHVPCSPSRNCAIASLSSSLLCSLIDFPV